MANERNERNIKEIQEELRKLREEYLKKVAKIELLLDIGEGLMKAKDSVLEEEKNSDDLA